LNIGKVRRTGSMNGLFDSDGPLFFGGKRIVPDGDAITLPRGGRFPKRPRTAEDFFGDDEEKHRQNRTARAKARTHRRNGIRT
jgi:hypothetical protein